MGALPSGTLAATCKYENSSEISYATVRFNTAYTWYSGSTTGCSGTKYDAQGVMAHEAGHVYGLNHVANSTLQVMKPNSGTCEVSQRLLGPADLAGMKSIYP
ncbi:matrixin family metalloprotease [Tessaracoccus sp. HDW20]|uniref:matrixin family metalloprotease n=1 Tax=Tessaracoccus coleopterorum TaxID=2714950 RepID=UPI0018D425DC|nr:matrixin family metalloprotease [Tessaracoccus coleopterorum]